MHPTLSACFLASLLGELSSGSCTVVRVAGLSELLGSCAASIRLVLSSSQLASTESIPPGPGKMRLVVLWYTFSYMRSEKCRAFL